MGGYLFDVVLLFCLIFPRYSAEDCFFHIEQYLVITVQL